MLDRNVRFYIGWYESDVAMQCEPTILWNCLLVWEDNC